MIRPPTPSIPTPDPPGWFASEPLLLGTSGPRGQEVLPDTAPVFEKSAEDGTVFRIYRFGTLEVRTMQERGGPRSRWTRERAPREVAPFFAVRVGLGSRGGGGKCRRAFK